MKEITSELNGNVLTVKCKDFNGNEHTITKCSNDVYDTFEHYWDLINEALIEHKAVNNTILGEFFFSAELVYQNINDDEDGEAIFNECFNNCEIIKREFGFSDDDVNDLLNDYYEQLIDNMCVEYLTDQIARPFDEVFDDIMSMVKDWTNLTDEERNTWYYGDGVIGFIEQYDELMKVYTAYYELYDITEDQYFYVMAIEYMTMLTQMCTNR